MRVFFFNPNPFENSLNVVNRFYLNLLSLFKIQEGLKQCYKQFLNPPVLYEHCASKYHTVSTLFIPLVFLYYRS